jgi:hypothetical protein
MKRAVVHVDVGGDHLDRPRDFFRINQHHAPLSAITPLIERLRKANVSITMRGTDFKADAPLPT